MVCCAIRLMIRHRIIRLDICKSQKRNFYQQTLSHKYCAAAECAFKRCDMNHPWAMVKLSAQMEQALTWNKIIRHQMIMSVLVCRRSVTLHRDFDLVFWLGSRVSGFAQRNVLFFFCIKFISQWYSWFGSLIESIRLVYVSLRMNCAEDIACWCEFHKSWEKENRTTKKTEPQQKKKKL